MLPDPRCHQEGCWTCRNEVLGSVGQPDGLSSIQAQRFPHGSED